MNNESNDNEPKEIGLGLAIFSIFGGLFGLFAACYGLHDVMIGLQTGRMAWSTRTGSHGIDFRAHSPGGYWFDVTVYSMLSLISAGLGAWMLGLGFKALRKWCQTHF